MRLLIIFLLVPLIEIALFINIGGLITLWPTLAFVVLTALVGAALVRRQGAKSLRRAQNAIEEGGDPMGPIVHGALIVAAGFFLITPGFFTDALGFALLLPPVRTFLLSHMARRFFVVRRASRGARQHPRAGDDVVDGDYHEVTPEPEPLPRLQGRKPSGWTRD